MVFLGVPHFGSFLTLYILLGNYIQCPSFHSRSYSWISDPLINCILNITTWLFCIQYVHHIFLLNNFFFLNFFSLLPTHPVVRARWLSFMTLDQFSNLGLGLAFCIKQSYSIVNIGLLVTCYGVRSYSTYVCILTAWHSCSNIIAPQ